MVWHSRMNSDAAHSWLRAGLWLGGRVHLSRLQKTRALRTRDGGAVGRLQLLLKRPTGRAIIDLRLVVPRYGDRSFVQPRGPVFGRHPAPTERLHVGLNSDFYKYTKCRTFGSLTVQLRNRSSRRLSARVKRSC